MDKLFTASEKDRPRIKPYVEKFILDALIVGVDGCSLFSGPKVKIQIGSLDSYGSGVIGLCSSGSTFRTVTLDPDFFMAQGEVASRVLVHHELGHCMLYRPHRTASGMIPDGSGHSHALSIMYPTIMGSAQYDAHESYYLAELFEQVAVEEVPNVYICE